MQAIELVFQEKEAGIERIAQYSWLIAHGSLLGYGRTTLLVRGSTPIGLRVKGAQRDQEHTVGNGKSPPSRGVTKADLSPCQRTKILPSHEGGRREFLTWKARQGVKRGKRGESR